MYKLSSVVLLAVALVSSVATSGSSGGSQLSADASWTLYSGDSECVRYWAGVHSDQFNAVVDSEISVDVVSSGSSNDSVHVELSVFGGGSRDQALDGSDSTGLAVGNILASCMDDLGYCSVPVDVCATASWSNDAAIDVMADIVFTVEGDGIDPQIILEDQ